MLDANAQLVDTSSKPAFRLREVTAADRAGVDLTTKLHMELLGFGPMARFGDTFIRETVYAVGLGDNLMNVVIAEVDGQPAGFVAYTTQADAFHKALIGNHFFKAVRVTLMSLLARPTRLRHIPRAIQVVQSRNQLARNVNDNIESEVLCFGVLPQYLTPAFVRETGLRIGVLLLDHVFDALRRSGLKNTRMIVDGDNPRALLFYQSLGAELTPCHFGGVSSYIVRFEL